MKPNILLYLDDTVFFPIRSSSHGVINYFPCVSRNAWCIMPFTFDLNILKYRAAQGNREHSMQRAAERCFLKKKKQKKKTIVSEVKSFGIERYAVDISWMYCFYLSGSELVHLYVSLRAPRCSTGLPQHWNTLFPFIKIKERYCTWGVKYSVFIYFTSHIDWGVVDQRSSSNNFIYDYCFKLSSM